MKKTAKALPRVSKADVAALIKSKALLLRLTKADKEAITSAASKVHLTATEFVTKTALAFASKV
jgi:uncharacterized protein (DUF1778 family)